MADVRQIMVAGLKVGLTGLDRIIEQVAGEAIAEDEEVASRLLELVRQANYVTPSRVQEYKQALLREYKRFRGEDVPAEPGMLEIRVLGPGCPRCDRLMNEVLGVLADLGINADLEHVRDLKEIARRGPVATPALVINGKIIASGRVPRRSDIIRYLKEVTE
jgi:small redox-active disulfide protein 2